MTEVHCTAKWWTKKLTEEGYCPANGYHVILGKAGLTVSRPTRVWRDVLPEGGDEAVMVTWAPEWACKIAAMKWKDSSLKPAKVRLKLIRIAASDETSRDLILSDPVGAWVIIKGM